MQISPIKPYNIYKTQNSFTGIFGKKISGAYKNYQSGKLEGQIIAGKEVFNRHTTSFFRTDLDWSRLGRYLQKKFSATPEVQTLIWGCSEGLEAYSLIVLLKHFFDEDYKKFLPVKAMDIDSKLIEKNKKSQEHGFIFGDEFTLAAKNALNIPSFRYDTKQIEKYCKYADLNKYQLRNEILDGVDFEFSNVLTDLDKIKPDKPALIMFRNMWPYIDHNKYENYAKRLYSKLPNGSVVILGLYDWEGERGYNHLPTFPEVLMKNGFKAINEISNFKMTGGDIKTITQVPLAFEKQAIHSAINTRNSGMSQKESI